MPFMSSTEHGFAQAISNLGYCNPFLPERIEYEKAALGDDFVVSGAIWSKQAGLETGGPNIEKILLRVHALVEDLRGRLDRLRPRQAENAPGKAAPESEPVDDLALYEDLALFLLFHRYADNFLNVAVGELGGHRAPQSRVAFFGKFDADLGRYLRATPSDLPAATPHLFACFFQVRRAFHHIFEVIIGDSMSSARLRAAVWQSIFTHDMRRYRRALYNRMADLTTLITGPSGTGKELVARAIGLSRYIPFDPKTQTFTEDFAGSFHPLSISALAPTLVESELFGHRKGAYTGALEDRAGYLEVCPPHGTVFLDEIGEIDVSIQVKLLRVLQDRAFQRLGETKDRLFRGKIIAATNRDLAEEVRAGRFRADLYYRLCADIIVTPSLAEQLRDAPETLPNLVHFLAERAVGPEEAPRLTEEVLEWIGKNLGGAYPWPGNVRELEQCVRNILIRRTYQPLRTRRTTPRDDLAKALKESSMTAEDLLRLYCTLVYAETNNYQETARRLGLDHRTIKARIDRELLKEL